MLSLANGLKFANGLELLGVAIVNSAFLLQLLGSSSSLAGADRHTNHSAHHSDERPTS